MIIGMIENMPADKAYRRFAGLDMIPRLHMAISLADEANWPLRFRNRLRAIRKEVQGGLAEKRNLFVHGAHEMGAEEGEFILTMSRWINKGDKHRQTVTIWEASDLAARLSVLAQQGHCIFTDYAVWKFGAADNEQYRQNVAQAKTSARLIRAQQIKRGLKLIFANLKPW